MPIDFGQFKKKEIAVIQPIKRTVPKRITKEVQIKPSKKELELIKELEKIARESEFQRLIYKTITGVVHRGTKESLQKELAELISEVRKLT